MPLFTYVGHYQGRLRIDQDRRSNYSGFAPLVLGRMADDGLLGSSNGLRKEMADKAYRATWSPIQNQSNIWRMKFDLGGGELELYAVETKD